jgi:hypothetical protein
MVGVVVAVAVTDGSPGWTRTSNLSVNSRMLCQLSYRGPMSARGLGRDAREDFSAHHG